MAATAHGTLTADVVTTVSVTAGGGGIEVMNADQTGEIWATTDGTTPAVGGAGSFRILGVRSFPFRHGMVVTVKLLSTVARAYSVQAAS